MPRLSVQRLFDERRVRLGLAWAAAPEGGAREFTGEMLHRPGVGLIGHLNLIHPLLAQVLGPRELEYLGRLDPFMREQTLGHIAGGETLCVIVGDSCEPPVELVEACTRAGTALITSAEPSQFVINVLRPYMQQELGEVTNLHGVFLDVLEIGVLITGDSSIGKSELALELMSRGHRLIADDAPEFSLISPDTVEGSCPAALRDFMEVRGLGIVNVRALFGDSAVKPRLTLLLVISLEVMDDRRFEPDERLNGVRRVR
jgi:HPr kinase/phosphorylase